MYFVYFVAVSQGEYWNFIIFRFCKYVSQINYIFLASMFYSFCCYLKFDFPVFMRILQFTVVTQIHWEPELVARGLSSVWVKSVAVAYCRRAENSFDKVKLIVIVDSLWFCVGIVNMRRVYVRRTHHEWWPCLYHYHWRWQSIGLAVVAVMLSAFAIVLTCLLFERTACLRFLW